MHDLLTFKQASEIANMPAAALEEAAFFHGLLVQIGTHKRIERDCLKELYKSMPRKAKPARLYERKARENRSSVYVIRDG